MIRKKKNQTVFTQSEKVAMLVTAGTPLLSVDRQGQVLKTYTSQRK